MASGEGSFLVLGRDNPLFSDAQGIREHVGMWSRSVFSCLAYGVTGVEKGAEHASLVNSHLRVCCESAVVPYPLT